MPEITTEQRQYKTYILSDQSTQSRLEVVPERGGIVTRWQVRGQDILYLDAERFSNPELSIRGGIPILFPICGNLPDNTYTHNGQSYSLKQHGFARDRVWDVTQQSITGSPSITLTLLSDDRTRAVYPFDFQLDFTYILHSDRLEMQQRYTNHSKEEMPFSIGFHPYFQVADKNQLEFEIPANKLQDQRTKAVHPFSGRFNFEQDEIDVAFRQLSSQTASVIDRARSLRLTLQYSQAFPVLVFWTIKGKDFYCLEPWSAPRNALNTEENLLHLAPGADLETSVNLSVEFLQS